MGRLDEDKEEQNEKKDARVKIGVKVDGYRALEVV